MPSHTGDIMAQREHPAGPSDPVFFLSARKLLCILSYTIYVPTKVSLSLGIRHASKSLSLSGELCASQKANK